MAKKSSGRKKIPRIIFDKKTTRAIREVIKQRVELNRTKIREKQRKATDKIIKEIEREEGVKPDRSRIRPIRIIIGKIKGQATDRFVRQRTRKSGKFKGMEIFKDRDTRRIVTSAFVRKSVASQKYWAHVKWIQDVLGISVRQARSLLAKAKMKTSLMANLQRAGLVTTSEPEQRKQ